jgi:hypothetical protein
MLNNQIFSQMRQPKARVSLNIRRVSGPEVKESDAKSSWPAGLSKAIWHFEPASGKNPISRYKKRVFFDGFLEHIYELRQHPEKRNSGRA